MIDLLYINWNVSPDIFSIGGFSLKWYSLFFVAGFFPLGYWIMGRFFKHEGLPEKLLDPMLYALLIGALIAFLRLE